MKNIQPAFKILVVISLDLTQWEFALSYARIFSKNTFIVCDSTES